MASPSGSRTIGADDELDVVEVEVAHQAADDGDLLGVLLAEDGPVGPGRQQQLGHDRGDPREVPGPRRPLQDGGWARRPSRSSRIPAGRPRRRRGRRRGRPPAHRPARRRAPPRAGSATRSSPAPNWVGFTNRDITTAWPSRPARSRRERCPSCSAPIVGDRARRAARRRAARPRRARRRCGHAGPRADDVHAANLPPALAPTPADRDAGPSRSGRRGCYRRPGSRARAAFRPSGGLPCDTMSERDERLAQLEAYHRDEVSGCVRCPLSEGRTQVVVGSGNHDADVMFVGEAPGYHEDRQGIPFVGQAGQLLTSLIEGIGLSRDDVFIANVLKCRPPGNRDPAAGRDQRVRAAPLPPDLAHPPALVCTLGNFATKLLSGRPDGISRVHGHELPLGHRRRAGPALPALPPGRRPLHAGDAVHAGGGLRPHPGPARRRAGRPGAGGPRGRGRRGAGTPRPPDPEPPEPSGEQLGLF